MSANRGKILYDIPVNGIRRSTILNIGIYGIFNSSKAHWTYYIISWFVGQNNQTILGCELSSSSQDQIYCLENVLKYGRLVQTFEEGRKFCDEFKMKWETGSNNTTSEQRDKKIEEILK